MSKKITAIALVLLMLALALPASAVIQATSVEIRGRVNTGTLVLPVDPTVYGTQNYTGEWNATSFAGFWYDLKDDLKTEQLNITANISTRDIQANTLWYNTTRANKTLKAYQNNKVAAGSDVLTAFGEGKYNVTGWQAQPYVAIKNKENKLAKLIIEQGNSTAEKKSLTVGETWDVGDGWTVTAQSIDAKASPRQVWLVLSKDGVKLDDKVIGQNDTYVYVEKSFAGESDVPLFVTYIDSVFAGATSDMVQLRYTWAISKSVTELKTSDKYGALEVQTANDADVKLYNKDTTLTLTQDGTIDVMGEIKFRVADSSTLRYYPMVVYQIGAGTTTTGTPTPTGTGNATAPGNATTGNQTVTTTGTAVETGTAVATATPAPTATAKEPGFEAGLAIAGLLAVAFLVLRQRK